MNVYNYDEIHDLRVPPRACIGDVLRVDRMHSTSSNRYGSLIATPMLLKRPVRIMHDETHTFSQTEPRSKKKTTSSVDDSVPSGSARRGRPRRSVKVVTPGSRAPPFLQGHHRGRSSASKERDRMAETGMDASRSSPSLLMPRAER